MRIVQKLNHIICCVLLAISTLFQTLALLGGVLFNEHNNFAAKMPWLVPVWAGMLVVLIAVCVLLVTLGDRHPWPTIIFVGALVSAFAALMVVFALRDALPGNLNATGGTQGMTTWKLLYRHASSVAVGVLVAIEAAVQWVRCRRERKKAEAANADATVSTIGLEGFAGDDGIAYTKPKKLKRSLRYKKIKTQITIQEETVETDISE